MASSRIPRRSASSYWAWWGARVAAWVEARVAARGEDGVTPAGYDDDDDIGVIAAWRVAADAVMPLSWRRHHTRVPHRAGAAGHAVATVSDLL
ncbi:hypothetical protein G6014_12575 [Dietzia kunjamensis]|nr:hypothetical protein [Dietzia kunjamensis]